MLISLYFTFFYTVSLRRWPIKGIYKQQCAYEHVYRCTYKNQHVIFVYIPNAVLHLNPSAFNIICVSLFANQGLEPTVYDVFKCSLARYFELPPPILLYNILFAAKDCCT